MNVCAKAITRLQAIVIAVVVIVVVIGAAYYAIFTQVSVPVAPEAILIGVDTALSGGMAAHGRDVLLMYQFAVGEINAEGGLYVKEYGKKIPVKLIVYDDKSDPTTAVSNIIRLATLDKVHLALTGPGSFIHVTIAPEAEKHQLLCIGTGVSIERIHEMGLKYYFTVFPRYSEYPDFTLSMLNALLPSDQRPKKIAIWAENTMEGEELAKWYRTKAPQYGYEIVYEGTYIQGSPDYSELILKSKAAGAEFVVAVPITPDGIMMVKQMTELGYKPKAIHLQRARDPPTFYEAVGKLGEGIMGVMPWNSDWKTTGTDKVATYYRQMTGKVVVNVLVGAAYANIQILSQAIEKAGSLDKEKVRQVLLTEKFETVAGSVKLDET